MSPLGRDRRNPARTLRSSGALLLGLLPLAVPSPTLARTARVPEDFSTIQAAIDHLEPIYRQIDTVLVQAGHYPERVAIHEAIRLQGVSAPGSNEPMPRIDGLAVYQPSAGSLTQVIGIHVAGPALTAPSSGPNRVYYESCRFDAGMEGGSFYPDIELISLSRCTLFGTLSLKAVETVVDSCTLYGPLVLLAVGAAVVTDNVFENVPGFAANIYCEQRVHVARNVVRGGGSGFFIRDVQMDFVRVEDNRIEGCAGIGIYVDTPDFHSCFIERNHVTRCGGTGIYASGLINATENRVLDCGGHGMDLVRLDRIGLVERNVVGRCGGDGIRLQRYEWAQDPTGFHARGNTVYDCGGAGIAAYALTAGSVSKNIAYRNLGYGLKAEYNESVPVSCNDWHGNVAGATFGVSPSADDLDLDPLFCDIAGDEVELRADSPLLDVPGCGRIGALGQGCEPAPIAMEFDLSPSTLNLASSGRWVTGFLEPPPPLAAGGIDLASIRLNGTVAVDPSAPTALGDHDGDGVTDLMVKFDRTALELSLPEGDEIPVTVTFESDGMRFAGTDLVRVRRGRVAAPASGDRLSAGSALQVRWENQRGGHAESVALLFSSDGGSTWIQVAGAGPNTGSLDWTVPDKSTDRARVALVSIAPGEGSGDVADAVLAVSGDFSIAAVAGAGDRGEGMRVLAIRGVAPNPSPHGRLRVEFTLGDGGPARLELLDVAGRVLELRHVASMGPGTHSLELSEAGALRPGIYFLRLRQGGSEVRARAAVTR